MKKSLHVFSLDGSLCRLGTCVFFDMLDAV